MSDLIFSNAYIFIMAMVLAILEIQIEGQHGWAMNLPTWRPKSENYFIKFYRRIMSNREVTGYHITMFSFVFLIFHLPYFFGQSFSIYNWSKTISLFFIFVVLWDYLWFVLNPYHPLKNFAKEHIWWHKEWWSIAPRDYYLGILLSLIVLLPMVFYSKSFYLLEWWVINILFFAFWTLFLIWFTLSILRIDNWKK